MQEFDPVRRIQLSDLYDISDEERAAIPALKAIAGLRRHPSRLPEEQLPAADQPTDTAQTASGADQLPDNL